jgi:hypothetical protein
MNEEDLRDCFAMFITVGYILKYGEGFMAKDVWESADAVLESRKHKELEEGIVAIKKRTRKKS